MIDINQVLIVSAITVMTVLLTVLGIQLIFVLKDLRHTLRRANTILDELEKIGSGISGGYSQIAGFVSGASKMFQVVEMLSKKKKHDTDKK